MHPRSKRQTKPPNPVPRYDEGENDMEDNDDEGDDDNNADDDNPDEDEDDDERVAHLGQCGLKQRCQDEQ